MYTRIFFIKLVSTAFFIGYLPLIPGTFGSLAGLAIYWPFRNSTPVIALCAAATAAAGFLTAGPMERIAGKKDPGYIVMDEVCGMLISLIGVPFSLHAAVFAFFVFRILDTLKPYPAGSLQTLKGSFGVMSDDIIAGIYTNMVVQIVARCAS